MQKLRDDKPGSQSQSQGKRGVGRGSPLPSENKKKKAAPFRQKMNKDANDKSATSYSKPWKPMSRVQAPVLVQHRVHGVLLREPGGPATRAHLAASASKRAVVGGRGRELGRSLRSFVIGSLDLVLLSATFLPGAIGGQLEGRSVSCGCMDGRSYGWSLLQGVNICLRALGMVIGSVRVSRASAAAASVALAAPGRGEG